MKNLKIIKLLAILFISVLTFTACSNDDHNDHDHEEELITTVTYTLTNDSNDSDVVTLTFEDLDGEGGNDGEYTPTNGAILSANTTYTGVIKLENATESIAKNITEEVKTEGDEHEFFYLSNITGIAITKTDTDSNGNKLGIETSLTTAGAGTGTLTVILKHEPTKPNNGSANNAGGSTDVEITFSVTVE
ncbi:MAG: type 1 periplasmic binding fold superfamily protein [Flavobacteriaceae bacterium]